MKRFYLIILVLFIVQAFPQTLCISEILFAMSPPVRETAKPHPISLQAIMEKEFDGRNLRLEKVLDDNKYYTRYYITYMSGKYKISGIMNVPKGKGPFPALILNHGYINTRYYTTGRGLKREQDYLARHGYVVLHSDYRNHAGSDKDAENEVNLRMGYLEDVINAVYAIKNSNYGFIDKENIGMLGHSLGGGIALSIMVTKPDLVKAYVVFAPISADYRDNFERWIAKRRPDLAEKIVLKFGPPEKLRGRHGSPKANPEFWDNISPLNFFDNIKSPVMVHHGTKDGEVPIEWSEELVKNFKKHNKKIIYYRYPGEPHEFIGAWQTVIERSAEFFDKYLK